MNKMIYFGIGIFLLIVVIIGVSCVQRALKGMGNPTGNTRGPDYPYYITTESVKVKYVTVPPGTKLTYEEHWYKKGLQSKPLDEKTLTSIDLPEGNTIVWGGVPVKGIRRFFNSQMKGYTVYAAFYELSEEKKTPFSKMWQSCNDNLGITVKNTDDWSFNKDNIADVESCSVLYQRYFKNDASQQQFLDEMLNELKKIN